MRNWKIEHHEVFYTGKLPEGIQARMWSTGNGGEIVEWHALPFPEEEICVQVRQINQSRIDYALLLYQAPYQLDQLPVFQCACCKREHPAGSALYPFRSNAPLYPGRDWWNGIQEIDFCIACQEYKKYGCCENVA